MGCLRTAAQNATGWLVTMSAAVGIPAVALVTRGEAEATSVAALMRAWGRTMLWIARVKLAVEGREHLEGRAPRVVLFNHSSLLDSFVVTALMPPGGTATVKKELLRWPVVGQALVLLRFIVIDRGHSERARASMHRAAERIRKEALTIFVAPEGTRTRSGRLQRFRRGAFHLALEADAPIVAMVIHGAYALKPKGRLATRPGTIHVRILAPERPTWTRETAGAAADAMARRYEALLEAGPGAEASALPVPRAMRRPLPS